MNDINIGDNFNNKSNWCWKINKEIYYNIRLYYWLGVEFITYLYAKVDCNLGCCCAYLLAKLSQKHRGGS